MSPNLERISAKARANPDLVFTSLYHHIADIDHLRTCYHLLKGNKAVGMDEVTKAMYARRSGSESARFVGSPQTDGLPASTQASGLYPEAGQ